jgi:hypothetical protein
LQPGLSGPPTTPYCGPSAPQQLNQVCDYGMDYTEEPATTNLLHDAAMCCFAFKKNGTSSIGRRMPTVISTFKKCSRHCPSTGVNLTTLQLKLFPVTTRLSEYLTLPPPSSFAFFLSPKKTCKFCAGHTICQTSLNKPGHVESVVMFDDIIKDVSGSLPAMAEPQHIQEKN